ncbi:hypothetical protein LX32DRAFT_655922 [Colletotrichum zoysiae]|uniref:Uncharacterized protein n=1 Tax=Colletotrichum zoysiae TaxID=1216348 RepID=A0AAD9HBE8_9PEZI|nr:hypothetical protein LX32DRAFT_655922 [Colletotrichum zoysiae]
MAIPGSARCHASVVVGGMHNAEACTSLWVAFTHLRLRVLEAGLKGPVLLLTKPARDKAGDGLARLYQGIAKGCRYVGFGIEEQMVSGGEIGDRRACHARLGIEISDPGLPRIKSSKLWASRANNRNDEITRCSMVKRAKPASSELNKTRGLVPPSFTSDEERAMA